MQIKYNCILLALLAFSYVYCHQEYFDRATPASRLDLLHALFTQGNLQIDAYHENTPDKAAYCGHFYSDKAPGAAALATPAFALAVGLLSLSGVALDSRLGWLCSSWLACAGSIGIIAALGGVALLIWLCRWVEPRWALVATVALFLGAAPLPYATMMFSHALVVGLLAIAVWAIGRGNGRQPSHLTGQAGHLSYSRWHLLAGFACGWALASEYSSGLVVVGIVLGLLFPGWRRLVAFGVGALPPLCLIPAYNWVCFGNPFTLAYSYQASFPEMREGLYAIKWPDPETAFNLLFSPTRGLFFWTPFLLMAGIGYKQLFKESPRLFWLTYAVPLLQTVVISGRTWDWQAGPTLGPRLLAPMLPLLALPCAFGVQKFPKLGIGLAAYSIAITTLATLTDACPSGSIYNPLLQLHIPLFLKGEFSPNLGMALGLPPYASVALFYVILIGGIWWLWRSLPPNETAESCADRVAKAQG